LARSKEELKKALDELRLELADRRKALPAHSARPWQIQEIEELEDREKELLRELAE